MNTKIHTALKQAYSNLGLSDEFLRGQAEALAATGLVNDDNLATVIQGQEQLLKTYQKTFDRLRTGQSLSQREPERKGEKGDRNASKQTAQEEPEWFRKYKKEQDRRLIALKKENNKLKIERLREQMNRMVSAKAKEVFLSLPGENPDELPARTRKIIMETMTTDDPWKKGVAWWHATEEPEDQEILTIY